MVVRLAKVRAGCGGRAWEVVAAGPGGEGRDGGQSGRLLEIVLLGGSQASSEGIAAFLEGQRLGVNGVVAGRIQGLLSPMVLLAVFLLLFTLTLLEAR